MNEQVENLILQLGEAGERYGSETLVGICILLGSAALAYLVARLLVLKLIHYFVKKTAWTWDDSLEEEGVFRRLVWAVPFLIIQTGIVLVRGVPDELTKFLANLSMALALLFVIRSLAALITAFQKKPQKPGTQQVPIKGYLELLRIALYVIGLIVVIAIVIDRSPVVLLSGLGALSAVLMLVFKDTILGFVASVQLSTNDMLRVGDWIEMPSAGADGDVIDISLHTVKVSNWDNTITTIPTWKLITESFKNWRGMFNSGGRRIKRSLFLDATSVRFLSDEEVDGLKRFRILQSYLDRKEAELEKWNESLGGPGLVPVNQRRLSNIGTFRAYAQAYLEAHPEIHKGMTTMVRQMSTNAQGVPLEVYCFTKTTAWLEYERIQGDIFDHLYAIVSEFGLNVYQQPAGADIRDLGHHLDRVGITATAKGDA